MPRMSPHSRLLVLALVAFPLVSGCDGDEPKEEPRGPEDLGIAEVTTTNDSDRVDEPNQELHLNCDRRMLVHVTPAITSGRLGEFVLAPPDGCGSRASCGWMALSVEQGSTERLEILSAQSPLLVDLPESMSDGTLSLRLELRDAEGAPVLTEEDEILSASFELKVVPATDCPSSLSPSSSG